MKRFITFGSISQFRAIVKNTTQNYQFVGFDEETKECIVDRDAVMPVVEAIGSEKIHGTNAATCYSSQDGLWVQSRKNIITPEKDNAGCAFAVYQNEAEWKQIINSLAEEYKIDLTKNIISVYFEWCGGNIQSNSCVTGLDKMAIIFRYFKVSPVESQADDEEDDKSAKWLETGVVKNVEGIYPGKVWVSNKEKNIHNVMDFPTVSLTIDFNDPSSAQSEMIKLTEEVEKNSGIANAFNKSENVGEGWVWSFVDNRGNLQRWKTKGEAHSKSSKGPKIKTLKPVDSVLEQKKIDFVNNIACTEGRLNQMWTEIVHSTYNGDKSLINIKDMGSFLKLVNSDVIKEEMDIMASQGLEPKQINGLISKVARDWFKEQLLV